MGCYRGHLYVQQETIDANFLASTHVDTPDPRRENPPKGQRILVAWRFPENLIPRNHSSEEAAKLILTVRFWDLCEEVEEKPLWTPRGYYASPIWEKRILAYKIEVIDSWGHLLDCWEHHFWTKKIDPSTF